MDDERRGERAFEGDENVAVFMESSQYVEEKVGGAMLHALIGISM